VSELLAEIGFEEMPAPWLPGLADQLKARFLEAASRELLEAQAPPLVLYTPRRLVLRADVPARQPDREEPVWGPALKVAKDAAGKWTGAALGFAKKNGVAVEDLGEGPKDPAKPGERYLRFVKRTAGRPTAEVVPGLLATVLRSLAFPKRMSWDAWLDDGRGALPFGRPIRWLVLLLDGEVVPFAIHALVGGAKGAVVVESGRTTQGHRFLPKGEGDEPIAVRSFAEMQQKLRKRFVLVDPAERVLRIDEGLAAAARGASFDDHGLREEWRDLVEYPTVLVGEVPTEFRKLPPEVLETVLVHHQKYISLRETGDGGARIARFAAVVNGDGGSAAEIVRGMERVVVARLRDASFFLGEDRKRALAERIDDLAGVTFHQGLGTYRDKAARMAALVDAMARLGCLDTKQAGLAREAARLAKADLVTLMVREFPELQGVMGGIYLTGEGAPEEVATAVRWHYQPVAVEPGAEPAAAFAGRDGASRVFAAVALADKLDTLAGYFGLGESPTGSRDPFGLRRAGQGAVRAVLDFWRPAAGEKAPDLDALLRAAVDGYGELKQPAPATARNAAGFLLDRLEYVLQARGFAADEVSAVVTAPDAGEVAPAWQDSAAAPRVRALADPVDVLRRVEALHAARRNAAADFEALGEAFKRAKNILAQQAAAAAVDAALFEAPAEGALHDAVRGLGTAAGSYEERLRGLASLRAPVARFFDDVLVMAEDPRVRGNRLALLNQALSLFHRIADISKLGGNS
jgi:glycyl-tRNA synthetase beta chain